jgi:hypothetical protein
MRRMVFWLATRFAFINEIANLCEDAHRLHRRRHWSERGCLSVHAYDPVGTERARPLQPSSVCYPPNHNGGGAGCRCAGGCDRVRRIRKLDMARLNVTWRYLSVDLRNLFFGRGDVSPGRCLATDSNTASLQAEDHGKLSVQRRSRLDRPARRIATSSGDTIGGRRSVGQQRIEAAE